MTSILATMERVGFVERRPNADDRRILNVYLTEKGKITQLKLQKAMYNIEKNVLKF